MYRITVWTHFSIKELVELVLYSCGVYVSVCAHIKINQWGYSRVVRVEVYQATESWELDMMCEFFSLPVTWWWLWRNCLSEGISEPLSSTWLNCWRRKASNTTALTLAGWTGSLQRKFRYSLLLQKTLHCRVGRERGEGKLLWKKRPFTLLKIWYLLATERRDLTNGGCSL